MAPGVICGDQLTTEVVVHGSGFSPVPIDVPSDPRIAIPTLTLLRFKLLDGKASDGQEVTYSGDPDNTENLARLSWKSQDEMRFTVDQEVEVDGKAGALESGLYDVQVQNPNEKTAQRVGALAVVKKPELTLLTPSIVCLSEDARDLELTGTTFLEIDGKRPSLSVEGVEDPFEVESLDGCTDIDLEGVEAKYCDRATLVLPRDAVQAGFPTLTLRNPSTASCETEETVQLRVVPPPSISQVVPPLACTAQEDRTVLIEGAGFLEIDGITPQVSVGGKEFAASVVDGTCADLETLNHSVRSCTSLEITLTQGELASGTPEVIVRNPEPAGCAASNAVALTIVPPPSIDTVVPPLVCLDDGSRALDIEGQDFLTVAGEPPTVTIGGVTVASGAVVASACEDLAVDGLSVQRCATLTVTLAPNELSDGALSVTVRNPAPAGCEDTKADLVTVVPGPTLLSAAPSLVCTEGAARDIVLTGTGFLTVGGTLPSVTFNGAAVTVSSASSCTAIPAQGATVESCTTLNVTAQASALSSGNVAIAVLNPQPAGCAAASSNLLVVPPLLAITSTQPNNFCQGTSGIQNVTVEGSGFVLVDGALPTVVVGSTTLALTSSAFGNCTSLPNVPGFSNVQTCNTIAISFDATGLVASEIPITVTNPAPLGCADTAASAIRIVAPPQISSFTPDEICSDVLESITIVGTGFAQGAEVLVGDDCEQAEPVDCTVASVVLVSQDGTTITASFTALPAGAHDITVRNAASCEGKANTQLTVHPTPLVFFIDPPVAYNEIAIDATIFTSGLGGASTASSVKLVDADGATKDLVFSVTAPKPNRILANLPGIDAVTTLPTLAEGTYSVRVTSTLGCVGELSEGLVVTNTLSPALLTSIDPSFVSPTTPTAVTLTGTGFLPIPRVYLTASDGSGTAQALRAVELKSATQLTAVVPEGLTPGSYDVVLVNANGEVDVLESGLTVTNAEPPVITSLAPASLPANSAGEVTINGSGFDVAGVDVELDCLVGLTRTIVPGTAELPTNGGTSVAVEFDLSAGVPVDPTAGSVCLVRLTNGDNAFTEFSALSVTNASLNLSAWVSTTDMTTARRALSLLAGRPTATSRYLYAIGGDNGVNADARAIGSTVLSSVESANVDRFGAMADWTAQRNSLPAPRTWAGSATIGRFTYLVGGHNGTSATNTVFRAEILDPLAGPEVTDLDATLGDIETGTGLAGGLYYYQVAAVFAGNDLNNPGGESLPGELLPVQLPERDEKIILTLSWAPVDGAHGYRVYRSPVADASIESLELVGSPITCGADANALCDCAGNPAQCRLTDAGAATTPGQTPMPAGSLGTWHAVDGARCVPVPAAPGATCLLGTAREGLATVAVQTPGTPDQFRLYAFGGRNAAGTYLNTYEIATVTVAADGSQTVSDWKAGVDTLSSPRAELGAWVMSKANSNVIASSLTPDDVWIFLGGGRSANATFDRSMEAGKLGVGGDLGILVGTDSLKGDLAGFGAGASNDQLYTFGGKVSVADGTSAELCEPGSVSCGVLPDLKPGAFNALGPAATQRIYMGATQESAFFFLAGGHNGTSTLATTEQTVQ